MRCEQQNTYLKPFSRCSIRRVGVAVKVGEAELRCRRQPTNGEMDGLTLSVIRPSPMYPSRTCTGRGPLTTPSPPIAPAQPVRAPFIHQPISVQRPALSIGGIPAPSQPDVSQYWMFLVQSKLEYFNLISVQCNNPSGCIQHGFWQNFKF